MGLPKIDQPLFNLTVPSTGQEITFRPFTVKEEKILLIARESQELEQIIVAVKQIIGNTCQGVDVDDLAVFDLEYMLIKIRAKSINNQVNFTIPDPDTEEEIELKIDLDDIEMLHNDEHTKKIVLNEQFYMMMRYPSIDEITKLVPKEGESQEQALFDAMIACIDTLVDDTTDEVYNFSEFSEEEVTEFVDQFTAGTITNITKFFETAPKMSYEAPYKDSEGNDKTFRMEGLETFFT